MHTGEQQKTLSIYWHLLLLEMRSSLDAAKQRLIGFDTADIRLLIIATVQANRRNVVRIGKYNIELGSSYTTAQPIFLYGKSKGLRNLIQVERERCYNL